MSVSTAGVLSGGISTANSGTGFAKGDWMTTAVGKKVSDHYGLTGLQNMNYGDLSMILLGSTTGLSVLEAYDLLTGNKAEKGYRPRQWCTGGKDKELIYCKSNLNGYFFDAILSTTTSHTATVTSHPIQSGSKVADHMYLEPVTISLEIAMSDVMASMVRGQWSEGSAKSVSCYKKLCELQAMRTPLTILTRLDRYENMVITGITVNDTADTLTGLSADISLQQILVANVSTEKTSARAWTTGTGGGNTEVQPTEPDAKDRKSFMVDGLGMEGRYGN